jgi:hypothetical protein
LSASLSPAVRPWGIPDELEPDELDDFEAEVAAGGELLAGAEVVVAAGALFVTEELELLPQLAATMAATASTTHGSPRIRPNLLIMTNLCSLSACVVGSITYRQDAAHRRTFPATELAHIHARVASCAL